MSTLVILLSASRKESQDKSVLYISEIFGCSRGGEGAKIVPNSITFGQIFYVFYVVFN